MVVMAILIIKITIRKRKKKKKEDHSGLVYFKKEVLISFDLVKIQQYS